MPRNMGTLNPTGYLANPDPLGIGLKSRYAQSRSDYELENPHSINSLPDPQWGGFLQALEEAGVDNLSDNSVGVKRGMWSDSSGANLPSTIDPRMGSQGNTHVAQMGDGGYIARENYSNHIGAPRRPATFFDQYGRRAGMASRPYVTQNPQGQIVAGGDSRGLSNEYEEAMKALRGRY